MMISGSNCATRPPTRPITRLSSSGARRARCNEVGDEDPSPDAEAEAGTSRSIASGPSASAGPSKATPRGWCAWSAWCARRLHVPSIHALGACHPLQTATSSSAPILWISLSMLRTSNSSCGEYNVSRVSRFPTAHSMTLEVARSSPSLNDFRCPATMTPTTRGGVGGRPLFFLLRPRALRTKPRTLRRAAFSARTTPNKSRTTAAIHDRIVTYRTYVTYRMCLTGHRWSNVGVHPTWRV